MKATGILALAAVAMLGSAQAAQTLLPYDGDERKAVVDAVEGRAPFRMPPAPSAVTVALVVPAVFAQSAGAPMTMPWTAVQLAGFQKHKSPPTRSARSLALVHVGMHDAIVLTDQLCKARKQVAGNPSVPRDPWRDCTSIHVESAVAAAAARVLRYIFIADEAYFDRIAVELARRAVASGETTDDAVKAGLALGARIGERMTEYGESDGTSRGWNGSRLEWYGEGRIYGPGTWEPTPPYFYYPPEEPFAPMWKTWLMKSADQFRTTPPDFGSPAYMKDLLEVVSVVNSVTDEQKKISAFWADGRGSVTPPGHWNQIADDLVNKSGRKDSLDVALIYARLNQALADAFIACWDTKMAFWSIRPITASRYLLGVEIKPPVLTPAFPGYVSGHSTFSGAAATVLGHYFPQRADELLRMAEQAAISRLYGGIHFRHDNEDGLTIGFKIGELAVRRQ